jgi:site-specific DNA recombinase
MKNLIAAIYARVSSPQQADTGTIQSQLEALRARVTTEGLKLISELEFVDDGYSGATLIRPALERLRDLAAAGGVDRIYVHCPDRLARSYPHQVLLLEEFNRLGVEVIFLNREIGQTPEDNLLLQVQGMVAEYERAKILERSRRGKRYAAKAGTVSVLSGAPYGYRYLTRQQGDGEARYEIMLDEARVVRQIFEWVGRDRLSIGEVQRRLNAGRELTTSGKTVWDRATIWGILKNPAYKGEAAFGKTRSEELRPRLRVQRGRPLIPKDLHSVRDLEPSEWITIPVPALVEASLFKTVQAQLAENRQRVRTSQRGARYLLQGLLVCGKCGYAYYGKPLSPSARKGHVREYAYYRCIGSDAYRFGGERLCWNKQLRTDLIDLAVWEEVCRLLENPERVEREYRRRLAPGESKGELKVVEAQINKLEQGLGRLIDSYADGIISRSELEPRMSRLRERIEHLQGQAQALNEAGEVEAGLRLIMSRLEDFVAKVKAGLSEADWSKRREIIRALVKRVEVFPESVKVVFRVGAGGESAPELRFSQHCKRSMLPDSFQHLSQ